MKILNTRLRSVKLVILLMQKPLKVERVFQNKETGEVKENIILYGRFPLMTDAGTFVINGAERCIVSQLVRSPGVYYNMEHDKTGKELFTNTVIPEPRCMA